ncbi:GAF and ANTAR domain-containing protein [Streptomyces sp. NPDC050997]|uniref:GAF and ANTAR domain-containing protein n=1 Tax=Streptomyces sp. NPDC050997 TaxID=3155519 RepID=UPI00344679D9
MDREVQLAEAFVALADPLADDVDPVTLLDRLAHHCVEIIGADAVGIMMATSRSTLRTMVVTDGRAGLVELFQTQSDEGPCLDCFRTNEPVNAPDLRASTDRWPRLAPFAVHHGYRAAHALPFRVKHQTIGSVNLLLADPGGLSDTDLRLAQALTDVAALALVHWNPDPLRRNDIATRAQSALACKATIEMATGMLAEFGGLSTAEAYSVLRTHTARNGDRLISTARALVRRTLSPDALLAEHR